MKVSTVLALACLLGACATNTPVTGQRSGSSLVQVGPAKYETRCAYNLSEKTVSVSMPAYSVCPTYYDFVKTSDGEVREQSSGAKVEPIRLAEPVVIEPPPVVAAPQPVAPIPAPVKTATKGKSAKGSKTARAESADQKKVVAVPKRPAPSYKIEPAAVRKVSPGGLPCVNCQSREAQASSARTVSGL